MTFFSKKSYTASSGQAASKQFDIAFDLETGSAATSSKPYLSASHIKAKVDGAAVTDFTIDEVPAVSTITFGATVTVNTGSLVEIYRETPRALAGRTVDFTNASLLTEANLDQSAIHNQFLAQEALDNLLGALKENATGSLDAESRRLTNLATPVSQFDACTKDYVDTQAAFSAGGAASAQAWETTADGTTSKFPLSNPTPSATVNELFVVEVGGVMQTPSSGGVVRDFKVYLDEIDSVYYLEFEANSFPANTGNTNCPPAGLRVSAQNMGISKSALTGNVVFESGSAVTPIITAKQVLNQVAKPLVVQDSTGAEEFSVAPGGHITTKAGASISAGSAFLKPGLDTVKGLVIKQSSGTQSANLIELQTDAGAELGTAFSNLGHLTIGTTVEDPNNLVSLQSSQGVGGLKISKEAGSTTDLLTVEDGGSLTLLRVEQAGEPAGVWKVSAANRALRIYQDTSSGSAAKHVVATGGPSQIDEILEVQTNTGDSLMKVTGIGTLQMSPTLSSTDGYAVTNPTNGSKPWNVKGDGRVYRNGIRAYSLVAAGGFKVDTSSTSNDLRLGAEYGDSFGPNGGSIFYFRVSDLQTRVTFSPSLGGVDYMVRAVEFHPAFNYEFEAIVSAKTETSFVITHTDEDYENGPYGVAVKFEVYM